MKRVVSLIVAVLMLIGVASAEMIRTDDSTMFAQGIELLRQINDLRSVEAAEDVFASITSGYNSANYFKMYAQALEDLHNGEYSSALMRLDILEGDNTFAAMLKQYSLPATESIRVYTEGRQAEEEERYDEASELYAQANILDSLDRIFELKSRATELTYERAVALFDAGKYAEAADLFTSLGNYMDSAERARQAAALIPTPEPTPTPSPTLTPAPTLVPKVFEIRNTDARISSDDFSYQVINNGNEKVAMCVFVYYLCDENKERYTGQSTHVESVLLYLDRSKDVETVHESISGWGLKKSDTTKYVEISMMCYQYGDGKWNDDSGWDINAKPVQTIYCEIK